MKNYIYKWLKIKMYMSFNQEFNKKKNHSIEYLFILVRQIWLFRAVRQNFLVFQPPGNLNYANHDLLCSVDSHM